jgi:hypothetical protein
MKLLRKITSAAELRAAWICPVLKAAVRRGRLRRSSVPKIAAAAAPSTPTRISHIAATLQVPSWTQLAAGLLLAALAAARCARAPF